MIRRRVKPGEEPGYERWLEQLIAQAATLPGYLGTYVHRPAETGPRNYTIVLRFDSVENLQRFEDGDLYRNAILEVAHLVEADATWEKRTGLAVWFDPLPRTAPPQPSRFRMAIILVVVVYALVMSIGQLVGLVLTDWPLSLRLFITIVIEAFLMAYVLMPWITKRLARFIYPIVQR